MVKYTTDGPLISATRINRFEPDPIWRKLRALKGAHTDAIWDENDAAAAVLKKEIDRLQALLDAGEQYDMPF